MIDWSALAEIAKAIAGGFVGTYFMLFLRQWVQSSYERRINIIVAKRDITIAAVQAKHDIDVADVLSGIESPH